MLNLSMTGRGAWIRAGMSLVAGAAFPGALDTALAQTLAPNAIVPITTPAEARTHGLESLRAAITAADATGQPLVLNPSAKVPLPEDLDAYLNAENPDARRVAAQLGKALFWDMAVGSDGQACASCHFHAGADNRSKNQLSPGLLRVQNTRSGDVQGFHFAAAAEDMMFQAVDPSRNRGPNYRLNADNFPFVTMIGNGDNVLQAGAIVSPAPGNTNDVVSSMGSFFTRFESTVLPDIYSPIALSSPGRDNGTPLQDEANFLVAAVGGSYGGNANVRRAERRNAPTVINAVFNLHNAWDGRANFYFNGVNPFGQTDPDATILVRDNAGEVASRKVDLKFASLASQAMGPPLNKFEMSFDGRSWPDIGKKMLGRRALATQEVHAQDSLLAGLRHPGGIGLANTYRVLIEQAFNPNLWDSGTQAAFPNAPVDAVSQRSGVPQVLDSVLAREVSFSQMEANFSFFFGVATMLYEAELVADHSPFDRWMETGTFNSGFGPAELHGLNLFVDKGRCNACHSGPELTKASVRDGQSGTHLIEPLLMSDGRPAIYDLGYSNIGVTPTVDDPGRGGRGPDGKPLSSSRQALFKARGIDGSISFPIIGLPIQDLLPGNCTVSTTDPATGIATCTAQELLAPDEVTGKPIFVACIDRNMDGMCGLDDEFRVDRVAVDGAFKTPGLRNVELTGPYFHNGGFKTLLEVVNFYDRGGNFCRFNFADIDPDIAFIGFTAAEKADLVAFLIALTDERVRFRRAPFDHPALIVPDAHPGDEFSTTTDQRFGGSQAEDVVRSLAAVGSNGAASPLTAFHTGLGLADGIWGHTVAGTVLSAQNEAGAPKCNRPSSTISETQ